MTETHADSHAPLAAPDLGEPIGKNVATIRKSRGHTLDEIALLTGLSKGYLSKIENGKSVPSLGTLSKIAQALACDIGHFLQQGSGLTDDAVCRTLVHERQPAVRGGTAFGYDYSSLAHKKRNKRMEPFFFTFPAEIHLHPFFEHDGEEFIMILRGRAEFETKRDGKIEQWILDEGDSLYIDSSVPHRGRSLIGETEALVVIYQPKPERF